MNQGRNNRQSGMGKPPQPSPGFYAVPPKPQPPNQAWQNTARKAPGQPPRMQKSGRNPRGRGKRALLTLVILALVAGGAYFGIMTLRDNQIRSSLEPYKNVFGPNIFINDVPLGGLGAQEAYDKLHQVMQERINSWNVSLTYKGFQFTTLNYGVLGMSVSDDELYSLLNEAWQLTRRGDIRAQKAAIEALQDNPHKTYTAQSELQDQNLLQILSQIAPYINKQPVNAVILEFRPDEDEPFVFQPEQTGANLNLQSAMNDIMTMASTGQSGVYELNPEVLQPQVTKAQLEETVKLRSIAITAIDSSSTENRNHNIRLSLSRFNGKVLKPGEVFSFNKIVGPRTLSAGFAEALEYAYGDLVTGVGGGVCQASTTLYQAAVTAGLSIVKRYPHSGKVDYTEMGQDATVYLTRDRNIDFQFKNSTPGDIYISARVRRAGNSSKKLVTEIRFYGQSLGDKVTYRLRSEVVSVIPPPEEKKYQNDNTGLVVTYKDEEKLKSKAIEGKVIETYLEKYENGVLVDQPKLITSDTFNPKPAVYWRGINDR
ncbi:MAG: VanW family protein [Bacillota bacterium]|nr:VanW family protein [Bacillota bacterium]